MKPGILLGGAALAVILVLSGCGRALRESVATGPGVGNFALLDHSGEFQELYYYSDFKAVVLFVHGLGCQIVRNQVPTLQELQKEYESRGVKFLGINANLQDDREAVANDVEEMGIDFPILMDESQHVVKSLGIGRTAEAILIETASWRVAFRGPVDDRLDYGVQREQAGQSFLAAALEALLAGRKMAQPEVESPGCLIRFQEPDVTELSYRESIAPILKRRCVACHREGGAAPFAMDSYRTVFGWSPMIREVVRTRLMPPWRLDPHVGDFPGINLLTPQEERLLLGWIDAGSPGTASGDPLTVVEPSDPDAWALGEPDIIVEFGKEPIPASGVVPYRFARAEVGNLEDVWVRAVEVRPSEPEVMHHSLVFTHTGTRAAARNPFHWFRSAFTLYAPGLGPDIFPENSGRLLPAGSRLIMQLHYTTSGRPVIDRPKIGLYLHRQRPEYELKTNALYTYELSIPPGIPKYPVGIRLKLKSDTILYSFRPHMHYRGRSMKVWVRRRRGERELLLSVPTYSFDWQAYYRFPKPLALPAGTRLEAEAVFDNSAQNRYNPDPSSVVGWGRGQTEDEMLYLYLNYIELPAGRLKKSDGEMLSNPRNSGRRKGL